MRFYRATCAAQDAGYCTCAITVMPGMFLFVFTHLVSLLARLCTASWEKQPPTYHHTCDTGILQCQASKQARPE